jgi:hypothetical protein
VSFLKNLISAPFTGGLSLLSGGDTGDFLFGKDYSKKDIGAINSALGPQLYGQLGGQYGAANASLMKALSAINTGYGGAKKSLAMQGQLGTRQIGDVAQQGYGSASSSLMNRGLYGSTALDAANRGVQNTQSHSLAELNSMLAQIGSNIDIGQGQAQAGVYGQMAGLHQNYASLLGGLGATKAGLLSGVGYGKQGGALGDILKIGGSLLTGGIG